MIHRPVIFSPEARDDLDEIYDWIFDRAGDPTALGYLGRIEAFCTKLDLASERGSARDNIRPGLRAIGFERSATIAFVATDARVTILRVFRRGRNWTREFGGDRGSIIPQEN